MKSFCILFLLLLSGCAMGPKYKDAPPPQKDFALIYLLRGDVEYGGGYKTKFEINDRVVTALYDDGYSWLYLKPGLYDIEAANREIKLNVEAGETYYVKFYQNVTFEPAYNKYSSENILKRYQINDIRKELNNARLSDAIPYEKAPLSIDRKFRNSEESSLAKFRIGEVRSQVLPDSVTLKVFDDETTCNGSYQTLDNSFTRIKPVLMEAEKVKTISVMVESRALNMRAYCFSLLSFELEKEGRYSLHVETEKLEALTPHRCIFTIKNEETKKNIPILNRKMNNIGIGDNCDSDELVSGQYESKVIHSMRCSHGNTSGDC